MTFSLWMLPMLFWLLVLGAAMGSFLNVVIGRMAAGKSIVWPGSRCGGCLHPVRLQHNIPLVSYWWLRGRCSDCGAGFSPRYFLVELGTGLGFVAVFVVEVAANIHGLPVWEDTGWYLSWGLMPPDAWVLVVFHGLFVSVLIASVGSILEGGRVPASVTAVSLLLGLTGATLLAWPWPTSDDQALQTTSALSHRLRVDGGGESPLRGPMPRESSWARGPASPRPGFYLWPVWGPLPFPPGSLALGLMTGLVGAVAGLGLTRLVGEGVRFVRGHDPVSPCAPIAMLAGAFLGWQPIVVGITFACLLAVVARLAARSFSFAIPLTAGLLVAWVGWRWLGPLVRPAFFESWAVAGLFGVCVVAALGLAATSFRRAR